MEEQNFFIIFQNHVRFYLSQYRVSEGTNKSKIKNKSYKIPLVIPIVLYTGKQKWNANKYLEKSQEKIQGLNITIGNYSLVDINSYTEKELLEDNTFISKL